MREEVEKYRKTQEEMAFSKALVCKVLRGNAHNLGGIHSGNYKVRGFRTSEKSVRLVLDDDKLVWGTQETKPILENVAHLFRKCKDERICRKRCLWKNLRKRLLGTIFGSFGTMYFVEKNGLVDGRYRYEMEN